MAFCLLTAHSWLPVILTVISRANGNPWKIHVTKHNEAAFGSKAVVRCEFSPSTAASSSHFTVFWKKENFTSRKKGDINPFIYHHDASKVMEEYRGRTALTGNVQNGDCSLSIQNMTNDESRLYVRVESVEDYSFYNFLVSITVTGGARSAVTIPSAGGARRAETSASAIAATQALITSRSKISHPTETTPISQTPDSSLVFYVAVPIAALVIVAIVASVGFLVYRKYSRSQSLDRGSSGYYLNFTRTSTNPQNSTWPALTSCPPQHEDLKVIDDEPVYNNIQPQSHPPCSWTADMDESVYANV